eukprot:47714_1
MRYGRNEDPISAYTRITTAMDRCDAIIDIININRTEDIPKLEEHEKFDMLQRLFYSTMNADLGEINKRVTKAIETESAETYEELVQFITTKLRKKARPQIVASKRNFPKFEEYKPKSDRKRGLNDNNDIDGPPKKKYRTDYNQPCHFVNINMVIIILEINLNLILEIDLNGNQYVVSIHIANMVINVIISIQKIIITLIIDLVKNQKMVEPIIVIAVVVLVTLP